MGSPAKKLTRAELREMTRTMNRIDIVQQFKSIEGTKKQVLKEMNRWAARGWRLNAFGWANGFQGGWYALMVRDLRW
jgi:hypothetical protein